MSLQSKEHRAASWDRLVQATGAERELWFNIVAGLLHENVGPHLDLYDAEYATVFVRTLATLAEADALDALREPYLAVDGSDDTASEEFVAQVVALLAQIADATDAGVSRPARELSGVWRQHLYHRTASDEEYLTVAEVASIYQVTPQAVYKWIRSGKLPVESTPGGGRQRIARSALTTTREQESRLDRLQQQLRERAAKLGTDQLGDDEIADRVRKLRA